MEYCSNYDLFGSTYELSGFIGDHLGKFLSGLIGGIGSILLLGFSFITLLIFALDIDLKDILLLFKDIFSAGEDGEAQKLKENSDAKEKENLDKIKKLSGDKKKKKEKSDKEELTAADLMKTESEEQTNIRIIRKEDVPVLNLKMKWLMMKLKKLIL